MQANPKRNESVQVETAEVAHSGVRKRSDVRGPAPANTIEVRELVQPEPAEQEDTGVATALCVGSAAATAIGMVVGGVALPAGGAVGGALAGSIVGLFAVLIVAKLRRKSVPQQD